MQDFNAMKLQEFAKGEFAKIARACKNCSLMNSKKNNKKNDSPNTLFTRS